MDLNKYKTLFVEEAREHLAAVGRLLVASETSSDPAAIVDDVFRHVHSVKGMAASMGYATIERLAHQMEDAVQGNRHGAPKLSQAAIDVLLQGTDALVTLVEGVASNSAPEVDADGLSRALRQIVQHAQTGAADAAASEARAADEQPPAGAPRAHNQAGGSPAAAANESPAEATAPPSGQKRSYDIHVSIDPQASAPAVRAFLVHRKLQELGTISRCSPTVDELKQGQLPDPPELRVGLATEHAAPTLQEALANVPEVTGVTATLGARGGRSEGTRVAPSEIVEQLVQAPGATADEPAGDVSQAATTVRVRTDVLDGLIDTVGELFIVRERIRSLLGDGLEPELQAALDALSGRVRDIHDQVMAVRMMPMRTLMDRFPRVVRDLTRALGKQAEVQLEGGEIELDRAILDHLDAPFLHTLRNAVDHGLESPEQREAAGKAPGGRIVISASRDRDTVVTVIEDDGAGLDPQKLRESALRKGLISAETAAQMSVRDSYFLICLPGFSTKSEVSDVSGRGVGMDAVRAKVESLGGSLDIDSEIGRWTRFTFRLPLTLAIIPVLLVQAAGRLFAIPVAKVVGVRQQEDDALIHEAGGRRYLSFRHALVPVLDLSHMLQLAAAEASADQLVVIEDGRDLWALAVERIVGYHEVVVKPLGDPLDRLEWFSGATILGDGQPILILDLAKALRLRSAA